MGVVATVKDVALRAGVSIGTVSNALNKPELVNEVTAARVMEAVRELGFVRNDAARQLRVGQSRAIGMILMDMRNPFFSALALGAEDQARMAGYSVVLGNSHEQQEREASYLNLFEEQRLRGLLVSPIGNVLPYLARLRERDATAVLVDCKAPEGLTSVSVDERAGGRLAAEHLIACGRSQIVFIAGPLRIAQIRERLEGFQEVTQQHPDISVEVIVADHMTIAEGRRVGELLARRSPGKRPDAVFACNDLLALGVMQSLLDQESIRIPEDVAIVGYDDIDFGAVAAVPLTSIRKPAAEIGATAVDLLLAETEGTETPGQHKVFSPTLVQRKSTRLANTDGA